MKRLFDIFIFFISFTVMTSPLFADSTAQEEKPVKEMSCCAMSNDHDPSSKKEKCSGEPEKKERKKDCGTNCPMPGCHSVVVTFQLFFETKSEPEEIHLFDSEKVQNEFYLSLLYKDLSYSFWHPPKYIS